MASRHLGHRSATTASLPARMNEGRTAAQHASAALVPLSISAQVFRKNGCGSTVNGRFTSATPTAVIAFDFISARIAAARSIGKVTATQPSAGSRWARLTRQPFRRLATRSGRSRCIPGSGCRRKWSTTGRADHQSRKLWRTLDERAAHENRAEHRSVVIRLDGLEP